MKNWKNTLTSICGLLVAVCGSVLGAGMTTLPGWVITTLSIISAVSLGLIGWATGKNFDLSNKTQNQNQLTKEEK